MLSSSSRFLACVRSGITAGLRPFNSSKMLSMHQHIIEASMWSVEGNFPSTYLMVLCVHWQ